MRIVFIGASELGYNCCEACIKSGQKIVGIITLGTEFSIKYRELKERIVVQNVLYKDFSEFEKNYQIPVRIADQPITTVYNSIEEWKPDLIIVIGWYFMIPQKIMDYPVKGVIGIHASLLPKYRGNAPLVWAMINGEKETGVTLFYIEKGTDEGDIIGQETFPIHEQDYISDVLHKAEAASIKLLGTYLPLIQEGNAPKKTQNNAEATYFPKRSPEDGKIDWTWDEERIRNFIRAQSMPYPGAFTIIGDKKLIIWNADIKTITSE